MPAPVSRAVVFARLLFWAALVFTCVMAVLPQPPEIIGSSDKVNHMLAFLVLTGLHKLAYRRVNVWTRLAVMALLGAGIEVAQMIPALHRDADWRDWLADMLAAGTASLAVALLFPVRRRR